jgi:phage recombination protein Bet
MGNSLQTLTNKLASRLDMGEASGDELIETLKLTAFRGNVSNAQMMALMVVANQFRLNPWTREIYAFPDKNNGIVPIVGLDGWSRIINDHPKFDGIEYEQDENSCTCIIYRKDRDHPTKVTEYLEECKRDTPPWKSHPRRMLRHKATIQCARLAFGYTGIFDQDEAEVFSAGEKFGGNIYPVTGEIIPDAPAPLPPYQDSAFAENIGKWEKLIAAGKKSAADIVAMMNSRFTLTEAQIEGIMALEKMPEPYPEPETPRAGAPTAPPDNGNSAEAIAEKRAAAKAADPFAGFPDDVPF